jgi:hypothetical protein
VACTGGGASTGVDRRGLYRRWCEACTGGGRESLLPVRFKMKNWVGGGHTGEYQNSMWFRLSGRILTQRYPPFAPCQC